MFEVVVDLPQVGENLHDHVACCIDFEAVNDLKTLDGLIRQEPETLQQPMKEYGVNQTGLLTSIGITTYAYLHLVVHLSEERQRPLKRRLEDNCPFQGRQPGQAQARAYFEVARKALLNPQKPSGMFLSLLAQDPNLFDLKK
jgi:hypothetical protein